MFRCLFHSTIHCVIILTGNLMVVYPALFGGHSVWGNSTSPYFDDSALTDVVNLFSARIRQQPVIGRGDLNQLVRDIHQKLPANCWYRENVD